MIGFIGHLHIWIIWKQFLLLNTFNGYIKNCLQNGYSCYNVHIKLMKISWIIYILFVREIVIKVHGGYSSWTNGDVY